MNELLGGAEFVFYEQGVNAERERIIELLQTVLNNRENLKGAFDYGYTQALEDVQDMIKAAQK